MKIRQWILIILFAALIAVIIRIFAFETIRVASPVLSETQKTGDRLIVEKWTLGPRRPMSIGWPFLSDSLFGKKTYLTLSSIPSRIKGLGKIKRNDLLAFNQPDRIQPLDRSTILLSRCVGLPGEIIHLSKSKLYINGKKELRPAEVSNCYSFPMLVQHDLRLLMKKVQIPGEIYQKKDTGFIYLTGNEWLRLYKEQAFTKIMLKLRVSEYDEKAIRIPAKGMPLELNDSTFQQYGNLINRYEGVVLTRDTAGVFLENGRKVRYHIFQENYYFMLNDHQGYLNDSRSFGVLPERLFIGKACLVLFSPASKRFMQKI
jgi:signal peptidase I